MVQRLPQLGKLMTELTQSDEMASLLNARFGGEDNDAGGGDGVGGGEEEEDEEDGL